jgi:hypothetical protein
MKSCWEKDRKTRPGFAQLEEQLLALEVTDLDQTGCKSCPSLLAPLPLYKLHPDLSLDDEDLDEVYDNEGRGPALLFDSMYCLVLVVAHRDSSL